MLQFGGLIVETPAAGLRLLPDHWDRLESAAAWAAQGFAAGARRIIAGVEADLAREASLRASAAAGRAARAAQMSAGPRKATAADGDGALTGANVKALSAADRLRADAERLAAKAADARSPRLAAQWRTEAKLKQRHARDLVIGVGRSVEGREEAAYRKASAEETVIQAARRGDAMNVDTATGRLSRQTSLDTLVESGALTAIERAAGEKYGEIFEAASLVPTLKVADWGATGGGDADHVGIGLKAILEAQKAAETLNGKDGKGGLHAYISERVPGDRAVWVLKLVAGQGRRISRLGQGGAGRARSTKALQLALAALADKWGLQ